MIERVAVVVPARDEERSIAGALRAIDVAVGQVLVPARVVVVLDGCTDGTLDVILATPTTVAVEVVEVAPTTVGAARAAGVELATAGCDASTTWLASTDADSLVAHDWLATHLALADGGVDAVVGAVTVLDWSARPTALPDLWQRNYELARGPAPVHGANLGVRVDAYRRAGGFPPLACSEDEGLVAALRATRALVAYTTAAPVTTSARIDGRARGGFADTLTEWTLAGELPA